MEALVKFGLSFVMILMGCAPASQPAPANPSASSVAPPPPEPTSYTRATAMEALTTLKGDIRTEMVKQDDGTSKEQITRIILFDVAGLDEPQTAARVGRMLEPLDEATDLWFSGSGRVHANCLQHVRNMQHLRVLRGQLDDEGFQAIAECTSLEELSAELGPSPATEAGLPALNKLTNLKILKLKGMQLTDAGLKHLAPLSRLEYLDLRNTQVTGTGLAALSCHESLVGLYCDDTPFSDAGIAELVKFPRLSELRLERTPITDAGMAQLKGHSFHTLSVRKTNLTGVGLAGIAIRNMLVVHESKFDDNGLATLAEGACPVQFLDLGGCPITDAGLVHLSKLPSLNNLSLHGTNITDAGLEHLATLEKLKYLGIANSKLTQAAVDRFKEAHPKCDVTWWAR